MLTGDAMDLFVHANALFDPSHGHTFEIPVLRTYQEIAIILTERDQEPISPARVEHLCRGAEAKIAEAMLVHRRTPSQRHRDQ